jgi:hypothetical protein
VNPRRERQRLAVVSGAGGNDAAAAFRRAELREQVEASTNLERAGWIVVLMLDPRAAAGPVVQHRMIEQRRRPQVRVDARPRVEDVLIGRSLHERDYQRGADGIVTVAFSRGVGAQR